MSKESCFGTPWDSQNIKGSPTGAVIYMIIVLSALVITLVKFQLQKVVLSNI